MTNVRVRFAPSPTGPLHIGGVRTALYNYLFARKHKGTFILRIEDTDQQRTVEGAEKYILDSLNWLGLTPDESPVHPGAHGPYRQSDRRAIYTEYVQKLIDNGYAYYAFDTPEEIETMKAKMEAAGVVKPQYNAVMRGKMKNSLTLGAQEVDELMEANVPYVIRVKIPEKEDIRFQDGIRDWVVVHSYTLDDKVLMKSDGMPTYHLANIVDDHLMGITHVIRGEEWLPSAPLHVLLYRFFGWEDSMPQFSHLPLIMKPNGKGKLSKRDGLKQGIPVFPMEWKDEASGEMLKGFKQEGFIPEAALNFLAMLGWNPGTEKELFSLEELSQEFSLERIIKGGARFDMDKAIWYNEQYLRKQSTHTLTQELATYAHDKGVSIDQDQAQQIITLMIERVSFLHEMIDKAGYLFVRPETYDEKVVRKKWTQEIVDPFKEYSDILAGKATISPELAKSELNTVLESYGLPLGKVMQALRVAVTGEPGGPDLMSIISFLGGPETAERLQKALEDLPVKEA